MLWLAAFAKNFAVRRLLRIPNRKASPTLQHRVYVAAQEYPSAATRVGWLEDHLLLP